MSVQDSYGRQFRFENPDQAVNQICLIQELSLTADAIQPSARLPVPGPHQHITFVLDEQTTPALREAKLLIDRYMLIYSGIDLTTDC